MTTTLDEDAELAARLVRAAGKLASRMRAKGLDSRQKSNVADIATAADDAAEALIVATLRAERPEDSIVGEEGTDHVGTSGRTWVIDPVDGTYNFFRGMDWWCSAMALVTEDDLTLGAVHHPATDQVYVGGPGRPATCNGEALPPLHDVPAEQACAATYLHPPFVSGEIGTAFGRAANRMATVRMLGSGTMDCVGLLRGFNDVVFQHSVADWDRLPGAALIRSLGGESVVVPAAGVDWHVTGRPGPVAAVVDALGAGSGAGDR
ncbi:inositol monophosphatase family protein [Nocardioides sp. AE5]|uniref:inositol monophosphatase family protein n=1 Tax=Nocardioides sp. AE5 TaxID=2962573 RepID=UPI00288172B9|nr:inositol monophosphatase family protein [Nocardioides sp. AE5]MDT0203385.1 inositol monophosphatase family protein [Nocardioides sp. AE5]